MKTHMNRWVATAAVLAVIGMTGCTPQKSEGHKQAVNAANERWRETRSAQVIQMAQQYFDTGDLERAETELLEAVSIDPENAGLHLLAGRVALERGNLERSFSRFDNAITFDPKLAEARYCQGIVLQRWRKFDRALARYREAYDLVPDSVPYLLAVSEMLVATNRLDEAIALVESKLIYFENSASVRMAMGQLYAAGSQFGRAADMFREASMLKPGDAAVLEELGMAQLRAGEHDKAVRTLRELIANHDTHAERTDLWLSLADAYEQQGLIDKAKETYLHVRRMDPNHVQPWTKLGELAWADGDLAAALTAAERSIALAPQRHEGYLLAGLVHQRRQKSAAALEMFDLAAERASDNAEPVLLRGIMLQRAGRLDEAAKAYAEALRRDPNDDRASSLLAAVTAGRNQ